MKKIILFIMIFLLNIPCYAGQKKFYKNETGLIITDVSGKDSIENIKKKFGEGTYQEIEYDETYQNARIEDNKLKIYDYKKENAEISDAGEKIKKIKINNIKQKLQLSDKDFEDLKEALR